MRVAHAPNHSSGEVAATQAELEKMTGLHGQQESFFPYLTGYVALYLGDYKTALASP